MSAHNEKSKVLIFILTYNAQDHIESVLDRIPESFWQDETYDTEILVVDDASTDETVLRCTQYKQDKKRFLRVLANPVNQGYGGNQKIGYTYAIEYGFDIVVMLHGDGQYPPENLSDMITPIANGDADIVFGSRMLRRKDALRGGMPLYKFVGNIIISTYQNWLLGSQLSEFHSGYRAYSVKALKKIPFAYNSNDFDFDTDIIIQALDTGCRIREIPIPTHYGDEICRVNGIKYAFQVARSTLLSRIQPFGIYYNPKFDYETNGTPYPSKTHFDSSHTYAISHVKPHSRVLDFGCGDGKIARILKEEKHCTVYGYDIRQSDEAMRYCEKVYITNLDDINWELIEPADTILLLDIVEHLAKPEKFLHQLRQHTCNHQPEIIITTGNVVFLLTRLSFLFGQFNYGKRGILDLDHKRLFTASSLKHLLNNQGFQILQTQGIPVPIPFILGENRFSNFLLKCNRFLIRVSRSLFSFQIGMVVRPLPTLDILLMDAEREGRSRAKRILAASGKKDSAA